MTADTVEILARELCQMSGFNPDTGWRTFADTASSGIAALELAGMVVEPARVEITTARLNHVIDRVLQDMGNPQPRESKQWLREFYRTMDRAILNVGATNGG